jgi:RsiW-degrading membrane proteinase PrsW (M82 family)
LEVIFVKGLLNGLLSLVSLVVAGWCFYKYGQTTPANTMYIIGTAVFGILMVVFGVMFLSGRVNKTEDIHITE